MGNAASAMAARRAMSWQQLTALTRNIELRDCADIRANGPSSSRSTLRLFGQAESNVRLTLFRDKHSWCPYCQKVWLWLEEKKGPYRVEKVTMFCYGDKESWYTQKVPNGMLPAIELDGEVVTESDEILVRLEQAFGPLHRSINDSSVVPFRQLERQLFGAWCQWLCRPSRSVSEEKRNLAVFLEVLQMVDKALGQTDGPWMLEEFSIADVVFVPYVERMAASAFYYKGYVMRDEVRHPNVTAWFAALETRESYLGTQSDYHTHSHDLPPQMGGCFENGSTEQQRMKQMIDCPQPGDSLPDARFAEPSDAAEE